MRRLFIALLVIFTSGCSFQQTLHNAQFKSLSAHLKLMGDVNPLTLILNASERGNEDTESAFKELMKCPMLPKLAPRLVTDWNNAYLASEPQGSVVTTLYVARVINSALDQEFSRVHEIKKMVRQDRMHERANHLRRRKGRYRSTLFINPTNVDRDSIFIRLVMDFTPLACSAWRFGLYHEEGHRNLKHFEILRPSCAKIKSFELDADEYSALVITHGFRLMKNEGLGFSLALSNFGVVGLPDLDFKHSYRGLRLDGNTATENCSYPSVEERIDNISKAVSLPASKTMDRLNELLARARVAAGG